MNEPGSVGKELLYEELTRSIIGCAFDVINELGAGFLESVYEHAMTIALTQTGRRVQRQTPVPVWFRGKSVGHFYADLLVDDKVIVELKAIRSISPEHVAQVINYLQATGVEIGLILNFGNQRLEYRRVNRPRLGGPKGPYRRKV